MKRSKAFAFLAAVCTVLLALDCRVARPPIETKQALGSAIYSPPNGTDLTAGVVTSITGASPIPITPASLQWLAGTSGPTITQATQTSDTPAFNLTLAPQAPFASASTNVVGGTLIVTLANQVSGTSRAALYINQGGTSLFHVQEQFNGTLPAIYFGNLTPSATNYTLIGDGTNDYLNGATSANLQVAGTNVVAVTGTTITLSQPTTASSTFTSTGNFTASAGQIVKQVTKTANYTVDATPSDFIVFTDSTSNTVQITCPAPSAGRCFYVKDKTGKVTTHAVTVTHNSAETIDGASTITMTKNFDSIYLCSDGTNWAVMSEYSTTIVP
jgi:hypothetical protein